MKYGKTDVVICEDAVDLGEKSAAAVAKTLRELLSRETEVRIILAAGESQLTFLDALSRQPGIDWSRVVCFNMDDFWTPPPGMPERLTCIGQTKRQLYDKVKPRRFEFVRWDAPDAAAEAARFAKAFRDAGPMHVLCQGIGTSGHLAFNEPGDADFTDPEPVRVVTVQEQSRRQLAADPNFRELASIPDKDITLTIPAMLSAPHRFTMAPLGLKRPILSRLFTTKAPTTALPASILLEYEGTLFVDRDSCPSEFGGRPG